MALRHPVSSLLLACTPSSNQELPQGTPPRLGPPLKVTALPDHTPTSRSVSPTVVCQIALSCRKGPKRNENRQSKSSMHTHVLLPRSIS